MGGFYAHLLRASDVRPTIGVLHKRLCYFHVASTLDDAIIVMANLRVVFRTLPPCVGMASLRVMANSWMTTCRLRSFFEMVAWLSEAIACSTMGVARTPVVRPIHPLAPFRLGSTPISIRIYFSYVFGRILC